MSQSGPKEKWKLFCLFCLFSYDLLAKCWGIAIFKCVCNASWNFSLAQIWPKLGPHLVKAYHFHAFYCFWLVKGFFCKVFSSKYSLYLKGIWSLWASDWTATLEYLRLLCPDFPATTSWPLSTPLVWYDAQTVSTAFFVFTLFCTSQPCLYWAPPSWKQY